MERFAKDGDEHCLKETELRLGLPGVCESDTGLGQSRNGKRGFSEAMDSPRASNFTDNNNKWIFPSAAATETPEACKGNQPGLFCASPSCQKMMMQGGAPQSWAGSDGLSRSPAPCKDDKLIPRDGPAEKFTNRASQSQTAADPEMAPAPKAQVVGWPPIRSFRKNTLIANSKATDDAGSSGNALYVKVSMDGAPYLRKVDLKMYSNYHELSSALEKMFSCFTMGQCGSPGLSESKLMDLLNGSEYVPTYEDKDGDWMLVGDVPWVMFVDSCKRLRIMKASEAIGLAPKAMVKSKSKN